MAQKRRPVLSLRSAGFKPSQKPRKSQAAWARWRAVDWLKSNVELAEEMGYANSSYISNFRRRTGAPQSLSYHKYRPKLKGARTTTWRSWNWLKQDIELARETGLSRERIRRIRLLLGVPKPPRHGARTKRRHPKAPARDRQ